MQSIPLTAGRKAAKIKQILPLAGACLSVCLFWAFAGAIIHVDCQSPSLYNSIHSSCSSGENKRERERKISGILGAYAAGLMILILILSCLYLRIEVPVVGFSALGSSEKAGPVWGFFLIINKYLQIRFAYRI